MKHRYVFKSFSQVELMKRLPVKSLIQFRSVSKAWKSFIDSSEFIAAHSLHRHSQPQHLLVLSHAYSEIGYFPICQSYIDDHTLPQQRSVLPLPPPLPTQQILSPSVIGTSHGLICMYGSGSNFANTLALIWNPSIRKSILVTVPAVPNAFGFGVCPVTSDPKIVSIIESSRGVTENSYRCKVLVYTLSSGNWRCLFINLPTRPVRNLLYPVVTDQFIYWCVVLPTHNMILSFDVTNESFEAIDLPDSLARYEFTNSKVKESLAMLQNKGKICTVWMMDAQRSFTKLYKIITTDKVVGFTKNGAPIMNVTNDDDDDDKQLVIYEPNSEHNNIIRISILSLFFDVDSYMETLLLLDRSDCISY